MAVLTWRHSKSKDEAVASVKAALQESGYDSSVKWSDTSAEVRYGPFASILHAKGIVTDDAVVIEKCSGLAHGPVLSRCRVLLERLFPGGERVTLEHAAEEEKLRLGKGGD